MPTVLGREVGSIGYGLMSLTLGPQSALPTEEQAFEALLTAAQSGCLVWNGAEFYGTSEYNSLILLKRFFKKYPEYADKIILNIKGAMRPNWVPDGTPESIEQSVENCTRQLGGASEIDMFECGRRDVKVPLEKQLDTLKRLVQEGKIGSVALTEVNANTIREAVRIVPIAAVEIELSIWNTGPLKNGILQACAELGILVLAYSPLGGAMLAGKLQSSEDLPAGDHRHMFPKYQDGNFKENLKLVDEIKKVAEKRGCTTAQVALGWLLALSIRTDMPIIIPIPGARSPEHIRENAVAATLSDEEMEVIASAISTYKVAEDRYHSYGMALTDL